jgi:transcriptional regulator with XRE-family HTH domain
MGRKQQGQRLRTIRASIGYTGAEMGRALGATKETISVWENGHVEMPLRVLTALQGLFRVNPAYITGASDDRFLAGTTEAEARELAESARMDLVTG